MADVEMVDAPSGGVHKVKAGVTSETSSDAKKRFEVKKVGVAGLPNRSLNPSCLTSYAVERCGSLGLGHSCRQLCHLP